MTWVSPYGEGGNAGIAADNISTVGTNVLSAAMIQLLKDVEFKADGSIVASYAEEINITMDQMIIYSVCYTVSSTGHYCLKTLLNLLLVMKVAYLCFVKDNASIIEALESAEFSMTRNCTDIEMVKMYRVELTSKGVVRWLCMDLKM